jgi:hypothetical protein
VLGFAWQPMATVQLRYGGFRIEPPTPGISGAFPITFPVDELLLLGSDDKADVFRAATHIGTLCLLGDLFGLSRPGEGAVAYFTRVQPTFDKTFSRHVRRWRREAIPALFFRAAQQAAAGRLMPELGSHLARIQFGSRGKPDEVGDFVALAAWSLDQAMRGLGFEVRDCALCGHPFLSSGRARYCERIAPSSTRPETFQAALQGAKKLFPTCQDVGKVKDYRARKRAAKGDNRGKR